MMRTSMPSLALALGDWRHIPLKPLVADTVVFTVK